MKITKLKIDPNNPAILAYEEAFKRGYAKLTAEQKKLLDSRNECPDIQNPELRKALIKSKKLSK